MVFEPEEPASPLEPLLFGPSLEIEAIANRWSVPRLSLAVCLADLVVLLTTYVVVALRIESYTFDLRTDPPRLLVWCAVLAGIWVPVAINNGAYQRSAIRDTLRGPYAIAKSTVIAGALFHVVPLVGGPVYSRSASLTVVLSLVLALTVWRWLASRWLPAADRYPSEIIVIGAGWAGRTLAEAIISHPAAGVRIRAFVDTDPQQVGTSVFNVPVHPTENLPALVQQLRDRPRVVLAFPEEAHASVYEQLTQLAQQGVEVVTMASVYEQVTGRIPVRHLGSLWWAMLPKPSTDLVYHGIKRLLDIALALIGLGILAILLPIVAPLLTWETRQPLFFTQVRIGRYGRPLRISKLRTLRAPRDPYASYWARKRGNNPSPVAALLRTVGIDELPQCWHVLTGQMSIVGPRPYVPEEVADYQKEIPFFRCRALVKPGLTGWAQVNWGYGLTLEDEIEKLQYDLYYVGHQSFYLDLLIILRTLALAARRARPLVAASHVAVAAPTPVVPASLVALAPEDTADSAGEAAT